MADKSSSLIKKILAHSELILNDDGSVYHLHLLPEEVAETIITVGDPDRVASVTRYFDNIEFTKHKREFKTQTGSYKSKRITVISTGIGTDNVDIVFNELDALFNIDLEKREIKKDHTQLQFVRIGTSGAIQENIPIDSFLISEIGIGFDSLLHYYKSEEVLDRSISEVLQTHLKRDTTHGEPYVVHADSDLMKLFHSRPEFIKGVTITNVGFYGPQSRSLRLELSNPSLVDDLQSFKFQFNDETREITNLEMETSGIYGLAKLLGHKAISLNAILANRATGEFSKNPTETVDALIKKTLDLLVQ